MLLIFDMDAIDDQFILNICFSNSSRTSICSNKIINATIYNKLESEGYPYTEIKEYLDNRFSDIPEYSNKKEYYKEVLWRINHHIEQRPKCCICENPVKFTGKVHYRDLNRLNDDKFKDEHAIIMSRIGFNKTCNNKECIHKYRSVSSENTMQKRYGIKYAYQFPECEEKRLQNSIKSIKDKSLKYNKMKEILYTEKRDIEYYKKHNLYPDLVEAYESMTLSLERYDESNKMSNARTSKQELELLNILKNSFTDIEYQYKSKFYNHKCDYYIPSLNLYIEYQGFYTHGLHPYNKDEENDNIILANIMRKAELSKSKCRFNYIETWTKHDVRKREEAKENKLNYLEIFPNIDFNTIPALINKEFIGAENKQLIIGIK